MTPETGDALVRRGERLTIEQLREAVDDQAIRRGAHALHYEYGPTTEIGWLQADSDVWAILKAVFVE